PCAPPRDFSFDFNSRQAQIATQGRSEKIADKLGIGNKTVGRARATVSNDTVEKRVGRQFLRRRNADQPVDVSETRRLRPIERTLTSWSRRPKRALSPGLADDPKA